ncbi:light-harvesting complex-like protein OHP2, chloroplastic [Mangifera indica]|uniref:light-harvesting complex-like protein OHP2, chloroplastic n=1 Tax=Mangifera indica TaxID=29780 RepID=UPI001CFA6BC6|nr:light-harvesting complex-like protein OHP2, chloroplastic [Mangifera indica]
MKMSVASSIPCIKIPSPSTCCSSSPSSSSSSSLSLPSSSFYRFSRAKQRLGGGAFSVTCSQDEGPIRRPVAPTVREPLPPSTFKQPVPPSPPPPTPTSSSSSVAQLPKLAVVASGIGKNVITLEFQRQKAKKLQEYFKQKKLEEANVGPFFGFMGKNEIANGRWAMFGFAVGMLTEYATGSDLVNQVKILLSNFGIVDLE